jgi:hypothetical protein
MFVVYSLIITSLPWKKNWDQKGNFEWVIL